MFSVATLTAKAGESFTGIMMQVHLDSRPVGTFRTQATIGNSNAVGLQYEVGCPIREAQYSVDETAKTNATGEWIMLDRSVDLSGNLECL